MWAYQTSVSSPHLCLRLVTQGISCDKHNIPQTLNCWQSKRVRKKKKECVERKYDISASAASIFPLNIYLVLSTSLLFNQCLWWLIFVKERLLRPATKQSTFNRAQLHSILLIWKRKRDTKQMASDLKYVHLYTCVGNRAVSDLWVQWTPVRNKHTHGGKIIWTQQIWLQNKMRHICQNIIWIYSNLPSSLTAGCTCI